MEEKTSNVDRISELPDAILHLILCLLPFKLAIKTSVLSKRWAYLWINLDALDFGEDFAETQTQEQFVGTVNRFLLLHKNDKIRKFRVLFYPGAQYRIDAEKWVEFAIQKSVQDVDIDFYGKPANDEQEGLQRESMKLPDSLYTCDSPLIHVKLGFCDFSPPLNFTAFGSLKSLYLKRANVSDNALKSVLSNCPLLSDLSLWECGDLSSIKILGPQDLQLKSLLVANCYDACEIEIFAPNLKSFHFCGSLLYGYSFRNVSALEDVYLNSNGFECTEPEHDYVHILSSVSNIKILTVCSGPLMYITSAEEYFPEVLPVTLPNLQELQILIGLPFDEDCLANVYGFFKHVVCACLERLFIELLDLDYEPSWASYLKEGEAEEPSGCWFYNLKTVRINNFRGDRSGEMRLVKFFLSKAVSLELLVVVAAHNSGLEKHIGNVRDSGTTPTTITPSRSSSASSSSSISTIYDQLLNLPKASSNAQILLCGDREVDSKSFLFPTHSKYDCKPY